MKEFWSKNKVFITGLVASIIAVLTPYLETGDINWKVTGFAVLMAALSYVSNQWRGQYVTVTGIIGTLAAATYAALSTGVFTWNQFILYLVVAVGTAVAPPPKSRGYENSETILTAKGEGEAIKPTNLAIKPMAETIPPPTPKHPTDSTIPPIE